MTTPDERTKAVLDVEKYVHELIVLVLERKHNDEIIVPVSLVQKLHIALRHYPSKVILKETADACPIWWGKPELERNDYLDGLTSEGQERGEYGNG